jgi:hypothetical protein
LEAQMHSYTAHITPRDGAPRRYALIALDREDALVEAQLLAAALFGSGFTYCVRAE